MINERIFGSPISGQVRKKLEDRQRVAGEVAFGDSVEAVYPDKDGNNQADLSSRTPFVRMWTSVKLVQPAQVAEMLEKIEIGEIYYTGFNGTGLSDTALDRLAIRKAQKRINTIRESQPLAGLSMIPDENGKRNYYITLPDRPAVDYSSKVYVVGDYNYQTAYGSVDTNESLQNPDAETSSEESYLAEQLFPQELKNNELLKPQAGITSLTSETEGTLGVIKRTVVNFVVHNFEDFDNIYNKYFLQPGATVFVDFGHSSVKKLYNPNDLINSPDIKRFLYESNVVPGYEEQEIEHLGVEGESVEESTENIGEVAKHQGDLEVLQGIVVDYNAKILTNGSVECSVTLVSANSALLDFQVDDKMKRHITDVLFRSTRFLGLDAILNNQSTYTTWNTEGQVIEGTNADTFELQINTPNKDSTPEETTSFIENLEFEALKSLSSKDLTPSGNEIRTGIYVNSMESDDVYVCWGFIEDIIINANFGFGQNTDDINQGNMLQVRMDSSNAFTTWNNIFVERQRTLSAVPEEPPVFIYPEWWGDSDPGDEDSVRQESTANGSYNYFNDKYPKIHYGDTFGEHTSIDAGFGVENSLGKQRIPIREVFINMETVTKAFTRNRNVRGAVNDMLSDINNDSDGVFDWKVILGGTDSELMIVDNNRPDINQRILDSGIIDNEQDIKLAEREQFQNMFIFNIMSPNSIVKDYNLEFKLPQGNIGNMYAIQAMSHESKIFPTSDMIDNAVAINSVNTDSLSILYQPDNGSYREMQIHTSENKDAEYFDIYEGAKYLIDNNIYKSGGVRRSDDILGSRGLIDGSTAAGGNKPNETKKQKQDKLIQVNIDKLTLADNRVANTFKDYYRLREIQEVSLKFKPNLMPYTLSLTTYGIGSVQPGDTFRVDYLPKNHFKNTFLQTMKVIHNVNSDGWYTTLDTQYRILSDKKQENYNTDWTNVYLSPRVFNNLSLYKTFLEGGTYLRNDTLMENINDALFSDRENAIKIDVDELLPYITEIQVKSMGLENIQLVLSFKATNVPNDLGQLLHNYQIEATPPLKETIIQKLGNEGCRMELLKFGPTAITVFIPNTITLENDKNYFFVIQGANHFITDNVDVIQLFDQPLLPDYSNYTFNNYPAREAGGGGYSRLD